MKGEMAFKHTLEMWGWEGGGKLHQLGTPLLAPPPPPPQTPPSRQTHFPPPPLENSGFLFIQDSYKIIYFDLDEKEHYHSH